MKTRVAVLILAILGALAVANGCNSADDVTRPELPIVEPVKPTPVPTPRERPPRCGPPKGNPLDCERAGERSES
jgi:hypothetical protein